ncbi:hypothetical protein BDV93DRAFT_588353 [Ceratobasidium sp. AG-I]|nr:hypothetical protein BDV93DRAFT_588353 [Ceratobasidium sp. AG-I]
MPPKNKKRSHKLPEPDISIISVENTSEAIATDNAQHGFIKLPPELHLIILSSFPTIPDAEILANPMKIQSYKDGRDYLGRFRVLHALSQTCRALRTFYLPLYWERLHSCMTSGARQPWYQELARGLEIQSKGLMRQSPQLRTLLRVVTVCLNRFEIKRILPPFVELLENLPNLHTIQIVHAHGSLASKLKAAFRDKVLPSVRSVTLPNCAHDILRCCPGVREVTCNSDDGGLLIAALSEGDCNQVQVLRGIYSMEFIPERTSVSLLTEDYLTLLTRL